MKGKSYIKYLILAIVLLIFFRWIDAVKVFSRFDEIHFGLLCVAVLIYLILQFMKAYRFSMIARKAGAKIDRKKNFIVHLMTPILGRLTPGKLGEAGKIFMAGADKKKSGFAHLIERILDIIVLCSLTAYIVTIFPQFRFMFYIFIFCFVLGIFLIWKYDALLNIASKLLMKKKIFSDRWFKEHLNMISIMHKAEIFVMTLMIWLVNFIAFYFLARSIGISLDFWIFSAILSASVIIGIVSGIPGGFGAREFSITFLFTGFGMGMDSAAFYSLLLLSFTVITETIFAGIGYLIFRKLD